MRRQTNAAWRHAAPVFSPLGGPSVYPAWRAQCFRRLTGPVFSPLGGPSVFAAWRASIYAAWRAQYFRRLAGQVFIPLGGPSVYPAWRTQCFRRLAGQYLPRLAGPVFIPLGACWLLLKKRRLDAGGVCGRQGRCRSRARSSAWRCRSRCLPPFVRAAAGRAVLRPLPPSRR